MPSAFDPAYLSIFDGDSSMFLRRSRSIDVLGSSKKLDAQQSGGEMKKSKPKLKSMRSFRFLKSPRLGFAPESSSRNPSQTPATRLDGSAISTPLSDAHGLGIKHSTGPGMPGSSAIQGDVLPHSMNVRLELARNCIHTYNVRRVRFLWPFSIFIAEYL